ncbi:MAG: oxidoreductase [Bacteroidota bacterium]
MSASSLPAWVAAHVPDQSGRVAVVTGANAGIGFETARGLALRGAHVVMACRSLDRAHAAQGRIRAEHPAASTEVVHLDLADLDSVAACAEAVAARHERVDLLLNNAGVMALPERRETAQGFEMQWGVNVLGHYALTAHLMPQVLAASGSRVVTVASLAHKRGTLNAEDLNSERSYDPWAAYGQSKLGDLVLAIELQRRLGAAGADGTMSVAAHPGWTQTELAEDATAGSRLMSLAFNAIWPLVAMETWRGALPTLVAATSSHTHPGDYIGPNGFGEQRGDPARASMTDEARDPATGQTLWAACERMTGLEIPLGAPEAI